MRHNKSGRKFGRGSGHRKAMFLNLTRSLLEHESIRTTEPKGKELRGFVEKLITWAIQNDLHARRLAYQVLNDHAIVKHLFDEIGPRYIDGTGGYVRLLKLSKPRVGDCAPMVIVELTKKAPKVEGNDTPATVDTVAKEKVEKTEKKITDAPKKVTKKTEVKKADVKGIKLPAKKIAKAKI